MKRIIALLLAAIMALTCAACSSNKKDTSASGSETATSKDETTDPATNAGETSSDKQITIGVACFSLQAEFPATINEGIIDYIDELGLSDSVKVISMDAQNDTATQVSQVDNMIAQGVDGIILLPMDADGSIPCVTAAKEAGVPLVVCNGSVNTEVDACVKSDDAVAGNLEMGYLAEAMGGEGKIAILHGPNGISAEVLRREGYEQILKDYPNIEIVAEPACNWSREEAMSTVENLLQANPDMKCIVAQNDEMAMGALQAVKDSGADVIVGGIDAIADAVAAVRSGDLACTVFQDAVGQGRGSVDQVLSMIDGNPGKDIDIPFILITKENVNEYFG